MAGFNKQFYLLYICW